MSRIAILGIGLFVVGCSTPGAGFDRGAILLSSGFVERSADTPQKQAMLAGLPRDRIVHRRWNGEVIYVYAGDPACNCAYLGNEAAFFRYQQNLKSVGQEGTAESIVAAQRGFEQQQSFVTRNDRDFDPEPWIGDGWRG